MAFPVLAGVPVAGVLQLNPGKVPVADELVQLVATKPIGQLPDGLVSDHRGVLVAALHEEPLGNVENILDRLLRVLIACHGHLRPYYRNKHTMSGVRVEKGWRQKSPTAVTASLETRPIMDGEPKKVRRAGTVARPARPEEKG